LHEVWGIVSPGNPLKGRGDRAPLAQRLVQCRAGDRKPHSVVNGFEAALPTPYTASNLACLRTLDPPVGDVWVLGPRTLATFHHWQRWREIFTMVPIAVVDRPGWRVKALAPKAAHAFAAARLPEATAAGLAQRPPPAWAFLTGPLSAISSTALRSRGR